jgi:hypothetical protein
VCIADNPKITQEELLSEVATRFNAQRLDFSMGPSPKINGTLFMYVSLVEVRKKGVANQPLLPAFISQPVDREGIASVEIMEGPIGYKRLSIADFQSRYEKASAELKSEVYRLER